MARVKVLAFVAAAGLLVGGAALHNVDTLPTAEDRTYTARILERAGHDPAALAGPVDFEGQVAAVLAVQDAVLKATPVFESLPHGRPREPKDVLAAGRGKCFDRSRAIEKMLEALGLTTRHLAIYPVGEYGRIGALLTPGLFSHAVTEVKTARGWMLVESNSRWIGLDAAGRVWTAEDMQGSDPFATAWAPQVPEAPWWPLFDRPFTYVIGLYSRHGGFFPPYTPVPDVNYRQLLANVY